MKSPFKDCLAVITGASGGIGYAFANLLARQGAKLVLVSRNVKQLEIVKQELAPLTDYIEVIGADLSTVTGCDYLIHQLERLPYPVEILINNAGIGASGYTVDQSWSRLDEMCQLNMVSLTRLSQWAANDMKNRRTGYILNVSAVLACEPVPFFGVYSATKAFVTSFSIALYQEMKRFNVVVSCLHPPAVATAFGQEADILGSRALQLFNLLHSTLSAEQVARIGLRGLAARRPSVVAGLLGKVIYASAAFTPRFLGLWLMEFLFKTEPVTRKPVSLERV
jgi:short-subunit dehydrogenase